MKKRILSLLLVLALCAALLPAAVLAEDGAHSHCVCGASHEAIGNHTSSKEQEFKPWTDGKNLPTDSGYYYLTGNVEMYYGCKLPNNRNIVLCLNGFHVSADDGSVISIPESTTLILTDCS